MEEIILDVVPIQVDEIYPTKEMIWHFKAEIKEGTDREYLLCRMFEKIEYKFHDCEAIIILEKGKVIKVINGRK